MSRLYQEVYMKKDKGSFRFLPMILIMAGLLAACISSGPQKTLKDMAEALKKNDSATFLAQVDLKSFAANEVKNMTRDDAPLGLLDNLGRSLGIGGVDQLIGSIVDMEARLQGHFNRGVSTGEMMAQCREAQTPDCPWVPESLSTAKVTEIGPNAAVAQVTTPARMTSWLALRKVGEKWLVVGQAVMESTARQYAGDPAAGGAAPAKPAPSKPATPKPAPEKTAPGQDNRAGNNQGVSRL